MQDAASRLRRRIGRLLREACCECFLRTVRRERGSSHGSGRGVVGEDWPWEAGELWVSGERRAEALADGAG